VPYPPRGRALAATILDFCVMNLAGPMFGSYSMVPNEQPALAV
jgi:hypothetical protein